MMKHLVVIRKNSNPEVGIPNDLYEKRKKKPYEV